MPARDGLVHEVANFAVRAVDAGLPPERRAATTLAVLDTVGAMALGAVQPIHSVVDRVARQWGDDGLATLVGTADRVSTAAAAFVNGTLAHCMDFDDTHLPSVLHPSASVVPTAFAVAESVDASGPRLLDAVAVGTEVCIRLGMAGYDARLGNSIFFERGQHATSICGTVGSAVAAAVLLSEHEDIVASAAGIAASMGSGLLEANRTGGTVKRVHAGWAAHCGVAAAQLACAGITGPPTVLEGRFGFFQAFCGDQADPGVVVSELGVNWHSDSLHVKPYPCNHFTHAGIDAALELRRRGVQPGQIESLELGVPSPVLRTIGEPAADKAVPATGYAAQFSGPYTVAAALAGGGGLGLYMEDFTDDAVKRPEVLALAARVTCVAAPECTAVFPHQFPARLTARLRDGSTVTAVFLTNRGGPHRPLTDDEVDLKFMLNTGHAYGRDSANRLAAEIRGLSTTASARSVGALLRAWPRTNHQGGSQ